MNDIQELEIAAALMLGCRSILGVDGAVMG